uniref:60S ribosomal export protein NMD3 n=1 Tax=Ditylenchus dipsaci TaxID=166011 RepID=A0A915D078_9BILA
MEELILEAPTQGIIACCECGAPILPNPANMCVGCLRSKVDITDGIQNKVSCIPVEIVSATSSRQTPGRMQMMTKVRLVDGVFIWTEPHSKRVKVKLTVQQEVFVGAILQQSFVVEFTLYNQMCDDCRRAEAKDYWRACVQIRQKCDFKKTLFYMEQLMLKHNAHEKTTNIKPGPTVLPTKHQYSQQLITHDTKSQIYDYKHTFCVDLLCEVTATAYWKDAFEIMCQPKQLVEFYVLEVDELRENKMQPGHGYISNRHRLADVWVVRGNQVGQSDAQTFCCRTHLGHLLNPGDTVLGYDVVNTNINNTSFDAVKAESVPDVVLVRKSYDRAQRIRHRQWKLKRLYHQEDTSSVQNEFIGFMEDIEEDPLMRDKINIYRKNDKDRSRARNAHSVSTITSEAGDQVPDGPSLAEMLDDLDLNDVEMKEVVEHLTPDRLVYDPSVGRSKSTFKPDTSIHTFFQSQNSDYLRSGYDRGHLAAAGNHRKSRNSIDQTFFLTNMSPQVGRGFNRDKWNDVEIHVRRLAKKNRNVYICTGPL